MSNVETLRLPSGEEALQARRANATQTCARLLREGAHTLDLFPSGLIRAFEAEAWLERPTPNHSIVRCKDFLEWITAPYPLGLESSTEVIEAILTNAKDKAVATKARHLFDQALKRPAGGVNNPAGHNQHKRDPGKVTLYNVQDDQPAPAGNSAAAGLRKLQKAADEGNEDAAEQLAEAIEGRKSVHRACIDSGLRKSTKIDRDVKQRCERAIAEWIVSHAGQDDVSPVVADLFAAGAKGIAIEIKNLVGEAIMDRRYGA